MQDKHGFLASRHEDMELLTACNRLRQIIGAMAAEDMRFDLVERLSNSDLPEDATQIYCLASDKSTLVPAVCDHVTVHQKGKFATLRGGLWYVPDRLGHVNLEADLTAAVSSRVWPGGCRAQL